MPKYSPTQTNILIICSPEQYQRFYFLKKKANELKGRAIKLTNREFLDLLLGVFELWLRNEEEKKIIRSY